MTIVVAEKEGHLTTDNFNKLCLDINPHSPEKITKPRIGDIFRIRGEALDPYDHQGFSVK